MQNLRNKLIVLAAIGIFAPIGILMNSKQAAAAASGPGVTIDGPLPLPVAGSVAATQGGAWNVGIAGTPSVNVASLPAMQLSGTPTVNVANTASNPVHVTAPAIVPFVTELCIRTGSYGCSGIPSSFTVPQITPGGASVSQLVIEYVSGSCDAALTQISSVYLRTPAAPGFDYPYFFVPGNVISGGGVTSNSFAQMTRIYGTPGTPFNLILPVPPPPTAGGVPDTVCNATISGQLLTQ
jgi:hypothetical protein